MSVLDSSAMIAFLTDEPEGEPVNALLVAANKEGEGNVYAHTVNLIEVYYDLLRVGTREKNQKGASFRKTRPFSQLQLYLLSARLSASGTWLGKSTTSTPAL